jgi:excisionase family DNA binding protein
LVADRFIGVLGVSRPTLIRLLDAGEIPSTRPNKHRRIKLADVEGYRQRRAVSRQEGLAAIVRVSEELSLYDDDLTP